ncbi:extracellular solute-binding protein [Halodesulfovibrio spirochaetisodalis]|uniref:Spermidine/putrescine ABC transporter substrate-binding protein n=1 Tax=Halodesulfovibrio spirochaetisodalis TaxID=1560234 RepID=A0A1B7XD10_9BACT|nr:extracellular solute-binding protein [Halodesulfovibrio spirochaetisodalis]OBQ51894.1 spermidine/putrescine ABC transporter substrate-binding protein [Halodesulfovibrio spirochaetisodalis]
MKKAILLALMMVLSFTFSAHAGETFNLLTWKGYAPTELIKKFEAETGYTVKVTYSNNEEMIAKLRATRGAGFDLAQPSQDRISSVQKKYSIYQPMDYSQIKSALFIPSMLNAVKRNTAVENNSYAVPFCWGTSGLIVNTAKAPGATDYTALISEKYKGRVSYRLKRPTLIAMAFAMGKDPFALYGSPTEYKKLMNKVADELIKAKPIVKNYWTNGDALLQSMRSGEVTVAMAWDNGGWKLHAENKDIDFIAPASGALGWIDTFAIPAKAKNTKAAYAWINFIMRPENAAMFTNKEKYATAAVGVAKFLDKAVADNFSRSFSEDTIDNIKWYPPVPAHIEAIEGKLLDKIKAAN